MLGRYGKIFLWWSVAFAVIYALAWGLLIGTIPIPPATDTAEEVAKFFYDSQSSVRWGAAITSWTGGFYLPLSVVLGMIMMRYERGTPILSIMAIAAGAIQTLLLVFPPMFWGMAAFTPDRLPDVTAAFHQMAVLTMVTTDQVYVFQWIPLVILCLSKQKQVGDSHWTPFPRWFGYFSLWGAMMFELAVFAYVTKTGVFAWNGLFVFWIPFTVFGIWLVVLYPRLFRSLTEIGKEEESDADTTVTT